MVGRRKNGSGDYGNGEGYSRNLNKGLYGC